MSPWREDPAGIRPMLASTGDVPLHSPEFAYEPKYDGIRALAAIDPPSPRCGFGEAGPPSPLRGSVGANSGRVRFWSRLGNEKTHQFPEIAAALAEWSRGIDRPLLIDGEIVALDEHGEPAGFQNLQGRMHLKDAASGVSPKKDQGTAFIAFDLLRDGDDDLRAHPLRERRARLEHLFDRAPHPTVRLSEQAVGDGRPMHARATERGWEGLVAKRLDTPYRSGRRTPDWRKIKLVRRQACVVGGWTDPRGSRPFFGALLLGIYDDREQLQYVGHSGAGFSDAELGRVWKRLHALQTRVCPFASQPRTNEKPHWVKPSLVVEVKFTEWTADRRLRHPTYLGARGDVDPKSVRREPDAVVRGGSALRLRDRAADRAASRGAVVLKTALPRSAVKGLLDQLDAIQASGGDGVLKLPDDDQLEVSNLGKVFWPGPRLTKGDLFRHYARVAPVILPVLADRPLVMKRYPNGITGKPFYQHRAPDKVPSGVRIEEVQTGTEKRPHLVGGSLKTLLYTAQLASISQDPWFSRVQTPHIVDHVAIDLDPPDGAPFRRVLDVAQWVRDELDALKTPGFAKTSGAGGLHVYIPMPPDTPYEAGLLFCQIVATLVAKKHPRSATIERSIRARGSRVYVDYLQNILGKTLACAYSARASEFAGVSTPLTWEEVEAGVSPRDFTIRNFGERLDEAGDVWAALRKSTGANLRAVMELATSR